MVEKIMRDASFLALTAALTLACLYPAWRSKNWVSWAAGLVLLLISGFMASLQAAGIMSFTFIRLFCHVVFFALPSYLFISAFFLTNAAKKLSFGLAATLIFVGLDAFFVEPRWIEVNYHSIESPLIKEPIRVISLADLQTDRITDYERKALTYAKSTQADLVLFPGDYIQEADPTRRAEESAKLNSLLKELKLQPKLGLFAVEGDMEHEDWPALFSGTGIKALANTQTMDLGPLEICSLTLRDSRVGIQLPAKKKFRIVFGHAPDFALRAPSADLLLAGHTHGGQVQIPFFGPILTLSRVPRSWAGGGMHRMENGARLIVSRGIGHERGPAPRLRFNCRPEIVVVDLVPQMPQ